MEQTKTRGGARANAGRKPNQTKKKPITVYLPEQIINRIGKEKIKTLITQTFNDDTTQSN